VIDIRIFQFTLLEKGNRVKADQSTGCVSKRHDFYRTSSQFFQRICLYMERGFCSYITFEGNWKKAKIILNKLADKNAMHLTETTEKNCAF